MENALAQLFPPSIVTLGGRVADWQGYLLAPEQAVVASAVEKRRQEFTAARSLVRQALVKFDVYDFALLPDPDRCPIWPKGLTGSISHTDDYCAVAVGRTEEVGSIGLDMEEVDRVQVSLWDKILVDRERDWILALPASKRAECAATVFAIKEALYKYLFPVTRQWLGFTDVEIDPLVSGQQVARLSDGRTVRGRHLRYGAFVLASFFGA